MLKHVQRRMLPAYTRQLPTAKLTRFKFKPNSKKRFRNNGLANMLFLESPAFVGFSWSASPADRIVGDARTARDARAFLLGWLERFPQYKSSPLFIAGESYGGETGLDKTGGSTRRLGALLPCRLLLAAC